MSTGDNPDIETSGAEYCPTLGILAQSQTPQS